MRWASHVFIHFIFLDYNSFSYIWTYHIHNLNMYSTYYISFAMRVHDYMHQPSSLFDHFPHYSISCMWCYSIRLCIDISFDHFPHYSTSCMRCYSIRLCIDKTFDHFSHYSTSCMWSYSIRLCIDITGILLFMHS